MGRYEYLFRQAERAGIADDPRIQQAVLKASIYEKLDLPELPVDPADLYALQVHQQVSQRRVYPFDPANPHGDVEFGTVIGSASPYTLAVDDLVRHMLVLGMTGSGKTNLIRVLLGELDAADIPYWCFDLKQDYRHMLTREDAPDDLLVLPWQSLRFNPVAPPPGVPPLEWLQVLTDIYGHANALLGASRNYLLRTLLALYRDRDILLDTPLAYDADDTETVPVPTFHDVVAALNDQNVPQYGKPRQYRDTIANRLEPFTSVADSVLDCRRGYPLDDLLERPVVFEFDGLRTDFQDFFMEALAAWVFEYRKAERHRGGRLRHVLVVDEAKRLFSAYKEQGSAAGLPPISALLAQIRDFGEGVVAADQEPDKVTATLRANTYTKAILPHGDAGQYTEVARSMNLSEWQQEFLDELGTGQGLVRAGTGSVQPVAFQHRPVADHVSDADLADRMHDVWQDLALQVGDDGEDIALTHDLAEAVESKPDDDATEDTAAESAEHDDSNDLSELAHLLLKDIVERPFRSVTTRYDEHFPSRYKGNKARTELVENSYVESASVPAGRGKVVLFELTDRGRAYAEANDWPVKRRGRGGIVHQFWQYKLKESFEEAGYTAVRERNDADVHVEDGDGRVAVEVAMGDNEREIEHVQKHLATGYDGVLVTCRNETVCDGIENRLAASEVSTDASVTVRPIRDVLDAEDVRNV